MVRQYKIHTDLDGAENRTFDMTNGLIRFYEPNDLGLSVNTNVWQSQGIGVMGDSSVVHNPFEFKFETFGADLHENYYIFNEFINAILKQKYVTLEYTNELGTFYADIQLSQITKTEGYGFNGTFSEKISFIPVTAWYVYEQLKFSKVENGEVTDNSKVYGAENFTTVYPNLNLLDGTKDFSGTWINLDSNKWITDGTYKGLVVKKRTTQWQGLYKTFTAPKDGIYTFSAYVKASGTTTDIYRYGRVNEIDVPNKKIGSNFDWLVDTVSVTLKAGQTAYFRYEISTTNADAILWTAGHKWENGSVATPWMPAESDIPDSKYGYKYDYTYFGEDDIERFSKWEIDDGIFSFTARMTPSRGLPSGKNDYGVRFLDEQFNEYTAIVFGSNTKPDSIQFNTDVNDEYYLANIGISTINVFSALNYQRFRTRFIQKGTMELVNVDVIEMNIKRKVEFA